MSANSSHNGSFAGSEERCARHELKAYDINGSSSGFCFTSMVPVRKSKYRVITRLTILRLHLIKEFDVTQTGANHRRFSSLEQARFVHFRSVQ